MLQGLQQLKTPTPFHNMAVTGCAAAVAAGLDLTRPVKLGESYILIVEANAWTYPFPHGYDLVYCAAEQECDDDRQPISLLLQALAGGAALLAMYSSMWCKAPHHAPTTGVNLPVSLESCRRTIEIRDLRGYG